MNQNKDEKGANSDNLSIEADGKVEDRSIKRPTRDEALHRAAKMKAAIVSLINGADKPLSKSEITVALKDLINDLDYQANNIDNFVYTMSRNGLIKDIGANPNGQGHLYVSPNHPLALGIQEKKKGGQTKKNNLVPLEIREVGALGEIQRQIDELIKKKNELVSREKESIIEDMKEKIHNYGITASELGFRKGYKISTTVTKNVRYRNEKGETWGGRGPKPQWVKIVESSGENLEKYFVG